MSPRRAELADAEWAAAQAQEYRWLLIREVNKTIVAAALLAWHSGDPDSRDGPQLELREMKLGMTCDVAGAEYNSAEVGGNARSDQTGSVTNNFEREHMGFRFLFALFIAALSSHATANFDFSGCAVNEIVVAGDQNAHVQLSCNVSNAPACAAASTYVGFDKSTAAGKQYLALFMMAQSTGAKVTGVVDHAVCSPWQGNVAHLVHLRVSR